MNELSDIFRGTGIEVDLSSPDDFLKIAETLTRIGIASHKNKKLYQSCHILHKQGRYVILHFKELFLLDGKNSTLTDEDIARRNRIVLLLEEWGLLTIFEDRENAQPAAPMNSIKIIPFKEKSSWECISKYSIGKK